MKAKLPVTRSRRLLAAAILAILAGGATWVYLGFRQAFCRKYAVVWMGDVHRLALAVERFHDAYGRYPVAFDDLDALRAHMGEDYPRMSILERGALKYYSDGASYVVLLRPTGDGPQPHGAFTFEFGNGRWKSWPECLSAEQVRSRFGTRGDTGDGVAPARSDTRSTAPGDPHRASSCSGLARGRLAS